jgi:hypothetical protein
VYGILSCLQPSNVYGILGRLQPSNVYGILSRLQPSNVYGILGRLQPSNVYGILSRLQPSNVYGILSRLQPSLNVFGDGLLLLLYLFWNLSVSVFLRSLKILKPYKITTFRRMNLPSSSGKRGETPILLDPVDRSVHRCGHRSGIARSTGSNRIGVFQLLT